MPLGRVALVDVSVDDLELIEETEDLIWHKQP
jgi:hypothetical protein